jgi:ABC-type glycerol-3-phosphate transport system substrate-binding protein
MKLRPFELGLVVVFALLFVVALIILKIYPGGDPPPEEVIGSVAIWGTLPQAVLNQVIEDEAKVNKAYENVTYRYISPEQFDDSLLNALADGNGPDLVLLSHEKLVEMRRRIQPISFDSFAIRDIRDTYIDGAEIFALNDGLYGYPIAVDPLMMYWNRNILSTEGLLKPPATWEDLVNNVFPKLIKRDFDRTINRGVVAMGEYQNVRNAFGVISTLMIQGGSQAVVIDERGLYQVRLQVSNGGTGDPLKSAADFYTRFSKPSNTLYSWNRSFEEDRKEFISENLSLYFGYGSEGPLMEKQNPNLNFDIAEVPQGASDTVRRTYGRFYALSLLNSTKNRTGAINVLSNFGSARIAKQIALGSSMVPALRSLVGEGSNDTYGRVTYQSASIARGWLSPNLKAADLIFSKMTEDINENRRDVSSASSDASANLTREY